MPRVTAITRAPTRLVLIWSIVYNIRCFGSRRFDSDYT
jgi:hypothetical protein